MEPEPAYEPTDQELAAIAAAHALPVVAPPSTLAETIGAMPAAGEFWCRGDLALRAAGAVDPPKCLTVLELPGICKQCSAAVDVQERATLAESRTRREIAREFRWAGWGSELLPLRTGRTAEQLTRIAAGLNADGRGIIVGKAGSGKTSLACAWLRGRIEAADERPRFVAAKDLAAPSYLEGVAWIDLALGAHALVLDDLGAELDGAAPESGLGAQRRALVDRIIRSRHDRGVGTVVTTAIGVSGDHVAELTRVYGDGIARRLLERAAVVRLGGVR